MKTFAVFGDPISHSISPILHGLAISEFGVDATYDKVLLKDGRELIKKFKDLGLSGANVTMPHKEFALNLSDEASQIAKDIGSANTLVLKDGKIHAHNTDALGFMKAINEFKGVKTAILLGAGGTAKAIAYILKKNGIKVDILNRSQNRLDEFKDNYECFTWDSFPNLTYDLIVNSTSAGLDNDDLPVPLDILELLFKNSKFAFDVIYSKFTPFLNLASKNNLKYKNGKDMLLFQAVLAFNLFFDNKFHEERVKNSMQKGFLA